MTNYLTAITWNVNPTAISFNGEPLIMWYGISWAVGIGLGAYIVAKMFKADKRPSNFFDSFFIYIVIALIIGARLGHCLFYDPVAYLSNPIDILKIREGGMASHGASIGMLIGVCIFSLKQSKTKINWLYFWGWMIIGAIAGWIGFLVTHFEELTSIYNFNNSLMLGSVFMGISIGVCVYLVYRSSPLCIRLLDRLIVGVCIGASFIRIGNLMNSEIYGGPTTLPWGFNFVRDKAWVTAGSLPSHPTQIYEALVYFCLFIFTLFLFWKTDARFKPGRIIGVSLIGIFGSRMLIESIKNVQVSFEQNMFLNMGQLLSIPFIILGIFFIVYSYKQNNYNATS